MTSRKKKIKILKEIEKEGCLSLSLKCSRCPIYDRCYNIDRSRSVKDIAREALMELLVDDILTREFSE